jgi:hypothetical protein
MREMTSATVFLLLTCSFAACQKTVGAPPTDFMMKTLDMTTAVKEADSIVLAYPLTRRELGHVSVYLDQRVEPLHLLETDTTLKVMRVFKGPVLPEEIHVRHYEGYGYILTGPPQGPSGKMGSKGVFFLRQRPGASFRSVVDYYRPDISTPWITGSADRPPCASEAACIAQLLFSLHPKDDAQLFSKALGENIALSRQLAGILGTFRLLEGLTARSSSENLRRVACEQESKWYALEISAACRSLLAGTAAEQEYSNRSQRLQQKLGQGGLDWVRERIQAKNEMETAEYLQLLANGTNSETRRVAAGLLRTQREQPPKP